MVLVFIERVEERYWVSVGVSVEIPAVVVDNVTATEIVKMDGNEKD